MKNYDDSIQENFLKYFHKVSDNNHINSKDSSYENKIGMNSNENVNSISDYFIKHNKEIFENQNKEDTTNTCIFQIGQKDKDFNNFNIINNKGISTSNNGNLSQNNINISKKKRSKYKYFSRSKAHGWLLYYLKLDCDLLFLKNKIIENLGKIKLSHLIAAYDNGKGIYVHVKFIKYFNFDNSFSKKLNILYKNKLYHPYAKTAFDWSEIDHLCKDKNNYIAFFNPNIPMQRRIKRIRLKIRNTHDLIYYNDIKESEYIDRRKIWFFVPSNFDIINFAKSCLDDLYFKSVNDNWEDYKGEKVVLVSLINKPYTNEISDMINLWTDNVVFSVEKNNIYQQPRYNKVILVCDKEINDYFEGYDVNDEFFDIFEKLIMNEEYEDIIKIILNNDLFKDYYN